MPADALVARLWAIVATVRIRGILVLVVPVIAIAACQTNPSLPAPVAQKGAAILAAAESGDYAPLRAELEPRAFLSDFGFGEEPDPVGRWEAMGPEALQTMGALLRMRYGVRQTNEGTLYEWPIYASSSQAGDLSAGDRELFRTTMSEEEVANLIRPDVGYTVPRLGILADGTWWFFILDSEG